MEIIIRITAGLLLFFVAPYLAVAFVSLDVHWIMSMDEYTIPVGRLVILVLWIIWGIAVAGIVAE